MGSQTGDTNTDRNHAPMLKAFMDNTNTKIANPIWAHNILTCLAKKGNGGSIIDYVLTDDLESIGRLGVDTHPIYQDHRPIIFTTNNASVETKSGEYHYVFRDQNLNKQMKKRHKMITKH
eukprot:280400_1